MRDQVFETACCIVGGGPAGMMLGYLLARAGVSVTVLEKHRDFLRDFRGDTVHPSTLEVLHELGLLEEFLKLPHQRVRTVSVRVGDSTFHAADFGHVPAHCKFIALMPQWDFLDFLSKQAGKFPSFELRMEHEVTGLSIEGGRITGVVAKTPQAASVQIRADLVIGCDGRDSVTRRAAALEVVESGVPIDVLWFRITRRADDPEQLLGNINYGKALVLIDRESYFQAGLIIRKGGFDEIRARGIEAFRQSLLQLAPYLAERVKEIKDWEQVKLLTVRINRLRRWYRPGLLCIGDAAHAMSPAGGVGINLAIQDSVAAANLLTAPLLEGTVDCAALASVQRRREFPARATQGVQLLIHTGFGRVFQNPGPVRPPAILKLAVRLPGIQRALGYAVGIGVRPEHVGSARKPVAWQWTAIMLGAVIVLPIAWIAFRRGIAARNATGAVWNL